jgi:hypothetical protein
MQSLSHQNDLTLFFHIGTDKPPEFGGSYKNPPMCDIIFEIVIKLYSVMKSLSSAQQIAAHGHHAADIPMQHLSRFKF